MDPRWKVGAGSLAQDAIWDILSAVEMTFREVHQLDHHKSALTPEVKNLLGEALVALHHAEELYERAAKLQS